MFSCTASASTCSSKNAVARLQAEPPQAARVAPVGDRGRHLEQREVPDDPAAPAAVQAHQRHQVHGRQRHARDRVEIGAVGGVEPQASIASANSCAWMRSGFAAAVLVGLDLDERRLRRARQPRDRPRVRIGLLELVGGAVHERTRGTARACPRARGSVESDGAAASASAIPRSATSMSAGDNARLVVGRRRSPCRARLRRCPRAPSARASSDGSHSQRSSTPSKPR